MESGPHWRTFLQWLPLYLADGFGAQLELVAPTDSLLLMRGIGPDAYCAALQQAASILACLQSGGRRTGRLFLVLVLLLHLLSHVSLLPVNTLWVALREHLETFAPLPAPTWLRRAAALEVVVLDKQHSAG